MKKGYCLFLLVFMFTLSGISYSQDTVVNPVVNATAVNVTAANTSVSSVDNIASVPVPAAVSVPEAVSSVSSVGVSAQTITPQQLEQQATAPAAKELLVKGNVEEVAVDGTYILIAGTKVLTTKEMIEDAYVEVGDKVEASVQDTADGKKLVNLKYIFDDEEPIADNSTAVVPSEPVKAEAQQ